MHTFLSNLDRRWIFLAMFLAVSIPLLLQLRLPETPTAMVLDVFNAIENLPEGSHVLLSYDYDPASAGELHPMAMAFTRHCAKKKHKLYFMTLWAPGVPKVQENIDILTREFADYRYGEDYVNLGFKTGGEGVIKLMAGDVSKIYPADSAGKSLDDIPLTRDLKNIQNIDLIVNVSAGAPGAKEWIQFASTPFEIPTVVGCTGVTAPGLYPYYPQQMVGLLGAIKGAAEYERAILDRYPELEEIRETQEALRRMGPQLVAHLLLIALIIMGNVIFFMDKNAKVPR